MRPIILVLAGCYVSDAELFEALDHDDDQHLPLAVGGGDCDNANPDVNPDATEICGDDLDNDCDGRVDDSGLDARAWYRDADGDGFGVDSDTVVRCSPPEGYVAEAGDCAPDDGSRNPGVRDLCDGVDQDCDGDIDEDATFSTWYPHADEDGLGAEGQGVEACERPQGYLTDAGDCDDADPAVGMLTWFEDADQDGFGDPAGMLDQCMLPAGYVDDDSDCDDLNNTIHPDAIEICSNGVDEDCDQDAVGCGLDSYGSLLDALVVPGLALPVGDLTGDGTDDLFISDETAGTATLIAGGPAFRAAPTIAAATFLDAFDHSIQGHNDFDTDGVNDLFFHDDAANEVLVHLGSAAWTGGAVRNVRSDAALILAGDPLGGVAGGALAGDLDCDGLNELVAEETVGNGEIVLLEWTTGNASTSDAWARIYSDPTIPLSPMLAVDLTGDGCSDLLSFRSDNTEDQAHQLFEGPIVGDLIESDALHSEIGLPYSPGDISGDGAPDLVTGLPIGSTLSNFAGEAHVFFGPITGAVPLSLADAVFEGTGNQNAGYGNLSQLDLDGDGADDLVIGAPAYLSAVDPGGVYVVFGPVAPGVHGLSTEADLFLQADVGETVANTAGGDLDADGYDDLVVPEIISTTSYILFGGGI